MPLTPLPIDSRLEEITRLVREQRSLVLVAEPGAGKTTRVPRALLDAGFAEKGDILVLEPRRIAARLAARRVADELGERVGERIGYQVRFEDVSSPRTRVRFLTEGILSRRLAGDPTLKGVSVVVLDEFHERHLHGDLALGMVRALQRTSRPDLCVIVMSATLEAEPVATFLDAPVLHATGRTFPVEVEHAEQKDDRYLDQRVLSALRKLVSRKLEGDVLVFLPGAAEIRRAQSACEGFLREVGVDLAMLHGDLPAQDQDRAVSRGPRPKVILSTNVAETSVTIEGIVAVVDSGLARIAGHSPWSGMSTLETMPISRASAIQRAGRAGRMRAGVALRLYTKGDFDTRPAFTPPEVKRLDLAEAGLLVRSAGFASLSAFPWLEAPVEAAEKAADALLADLGAVDAEGKLTAIGRRMLELPLHPRGARLLLEGVSRNVGPRAALLAALLGEREIRVGVRNPGRGGGGHGPAPDVESGASDLIARLEAFEAATYGGLDAGRIRNHDLDVGAVQGAARSRDQLLRAIGHRGGHEPRADLVTEEPSLLRSILAAFPDRVGKRRAPRSADIVFAGGGSAKLADTSVVREAELLVAVEAEERRASGGAIRSASAIEPEWLLEDYPASIEERNEVRFDATRNRVERVSELRYRGLVLDASRSLDMKDEDAAPVLAEAALASLASGNSTLLDIDAYNRLKIRIAFAAANGAQGASLSADALKNALIRACAGARSFEDLKSASLLDVITAEMPSETRRALEDLAPESLRLPGGRTLRIQYEEGKPPYVESRLQDFFGMKEGPSVAKGRVPLVLHLLAPNQRAVQVSTDLMGFWDRHYPAIRKELMRKYPRHSWPEDPRTAVPPAPKPVRTK